MASATAITTPGLIPQQDHTLDPFDTPLDDGNEQDDEWWNDDETKSIIAKPQNAATGSRMTQWPTAEKSEKNENMKHNRTSSRKLANRYSVQKPTREKSRQMQKKKNAKAGIKVVTNFPPRQRNQPLVQLPRNPAQGGQFVDLAALQALDSHAPSEQGGLWKSIMDLLPHTREAESRPGHSSNEPQQSTIQRIANQRGNDHLPAPLRIEPDLSPNDRQLTIGISIPSYKLDEHVLSPETATSATSKIIQSYGQRTPSDEMPQTPAIVITPAQEYSIWSPDTQDSALSPPRARATSSVYSRATNFGFGVPAAPDAPPMPQMPAYAAKENEERVQNKLAAARESIGTVFSDDDEWTSPTQSRIMSSHTIFEEDESPMVARKGRARSFSVASKRASGMTPAIHRQSRGWWNTITTPFLTRSNTLISPQTTNQDHPALPSLEIAALNAQKTSNDPKTWEKTFSPVTPYTSTTIASDIWWDKQSPSGPVSNPFRRTVTEAFASANGHRSQKSEDESGTLEFMLSTSAHPDNNLHAALSTRTQATGVSALSSSDREAPFILSDSISGQSHAQAPQVSVVQPQSNSTLQTASTYRAPLIDAFPMPPRAVVARTLSDIPQSPQPPPYSPPRENFRRYRAVLPPDHPGYQSNLQEPSSPGPLSPGLQQAMSARGGIALSDVPVTPPVARRPMIKLNSAYPGLPANPRVGLAITGADLGITSEKARKKEAKRQRYEREDAVAHKAGGLWRGRGCIPTRGCYGRQGVEGRKRRRMWFGLIAGLLAMIILIVVLATTLHRKPNEAVEPSQWLNLTGFPPIYSGVSTVAMPDNPVAKTACVFPATVWSCALPKEQQQSVVGNGGLPNQPNFRIDIQWDNSTASNDTFANVTGIGKKNTRRVVEVGNGNALRAGQFIKRLLLGRQDTTFSPSPPPPSLAEQFFLGNTTDGVISKDKAGEATPFYITFMSPSSILSLSKRATGTTTAKKAANSGTTTNSSSNQFPDITDFIPPPDSNADGTAAPANLLPFPFQQPIRLYDRGLDTEHYGFYTYFNRSIFLKSTTPLNQSNLESGGAEGVDGEVPDDENGGSTESSAAVRCTWSETRFLVQMWTRKLNVSASLLGPPSSTSSSTLPTSNSASVAGVTDGANVTANNFMRPGSFPYPITITTDRHGGDPAKKLLYCYRLDDREHYAVGNGNKKVQLEQRGFGGTLINPAPNLFGNDSIPSLGGFDGGTGGCGCEWQNFKNVIRS
jgi:hypothetical protein